jgi:hypothetical protein
MPGLWGGGLSGQSLGWTIIAELQLGLSKKHAFGLTI